MQAAHRCKLDFGVGVRQTVDDVIHEILSLYDLKD